MSTDSPFSASTDLPFQREGAFVDGYERFDSFAAPSPEELKGRAERLLADRREGGASTITTGYACGTVGVQADQTHYSGGFALLMPLQQGIAVAARRAESAGVVCEDQRHTWTAGDDDLPSWVVAIHRIVREVVPDASVEVAVVSTVPGVCRDGYVAALAVALIRAIRELELSAAANLDDVESLRDDVVPLLAAELGTAIERPYSTAYLLATFAGSDPAFTLVDTKTREHLPVETEAREELQWAVIDPVVQEPGSVDFHQKRRAQAKEALNHLRSTRFAGIDAFRDLDYRDLEAALEVLPEHLRPVVRHLVTENHRVQKLVAAMRRGDWQMIGGLLLMSHASQRDQWQGTSPPVDALVAEAETRTHNGLYGACMTGRSGAVLVTGRPNSFPEGLYQLSEAVQPVLGHVPQIMVP